jgi:Rps23 Pro-64 3,4-dihydroxylase Tpa1-like proline 4-hydroxylase
MNYEKLHVDYPEIIVYDNVLLSDDCNQLAKYMIDTKKDNPTQSGMPWEKDNSIYLQDIPEKFKNYLLSYREVLTSLVSKEYNKTLYPTYSDIVLWNEGDFMIPHVDNGSRGTEQDKIALGCRDYSAVTYLNDDFEGGETFVEGYTNNPISGSVIVFPSAYEHGVNEVIEGKRVTFAMWFTQNDTKIEEIH